MIKVNAHIPVLVIAIALLSWSLPLPAQAAEDAKVQERQFFSMTTVMNLKAYGQGAADALDRAQERVEDLDALLSVGTEGSEVWTINRDKKAVLSDDPAALTEACLRLYQETDGAFDFTIYPIMNLWGFTKYFEDSQDRERLIRHVPAPEEIDALLPYVDSSKVTYDKASRTLTLPPEAKIDFGGIAKGYASQQVMNIFREEGVTGGLADLGGNIQVMGHKPDGNPWRVGIEDPSDASENLGILSLSEDSAVITSGGYERYLVDRDGTRYSHIIDPSTGYPVENDLTSVSIVCGDGTLADGLATSLCVMGKDRAIAFWKAHADQFDMVLFDTGQGLTVSEGLKDSFFSDRYQITIVSAPEAETEETS